MYPELNQSTLLKKRCQLEPICSVYGALSLELSKKVLENSGNFGEPLIEKEQTKVPRVPHTGSFENHKRAPYTGQAKDLFGTRLFESVKPKVGRTA